MSDETEGHEEGTSNNIVYFTIYDPNTYGRIAIERQNILCKSVCWDWTTKYPNWKELWVLSYEVPGPANLGASSLLSKVVTMWTFLEKQRILPPRPKPTFATYEEIERLPSNQIDSIRKDIARLRGKLGDLATAHPLWKSFVEAPQGGLTCVLATLADVQKEMQAYEAKNGYTPDWLKPRA